MADEWLKPPGETRRSVEAAVVMLLVLAALLLPPAPGGEPAWRISPEIFLLESDAAEPPAADDPGWAPLQSYAQAPPDTQAWVRWENAPAPDFNGPLALALSGPFSAEIWWNGERIGAKGAPGPDAASERAGPIDAVLALPPGLVQDRNTLLIRYSSHRAYYTPSAVLQGVYLTPYSADARRPVRYYAPVVLLSGALAALAGFFVYYGRMRGDARAYWLAAGLAGLIFAGAAEVSRAWINYPYEWHQPRQAATLIGFGVFGSGLLVFIHKRWPAPRLLDDLPVPRLAFSILVAVFWLVFVLMETGYDAKTSRSFAMLAFLAAAQASLAGVRGVKDVGATTPLTVALLLYAALLPYDLMDRGAYALAAAFFAWALLRDASWLVPRPAEAPVLERLALQTGGGAAFLPLDEIVRLKAAGNYTEVYRANGDVVLDNRGLTALMEALESARPGRFMRVHRSWAVDLDRAERLVSQEGSRYRLRLAEETEVPVSRDKVAALRAKLGG